MAGPDPTYDSAEASHRALREIRHELERHPAVSTASGFPPGSHSAVEAQLLPARLDVAVESATLTARWFAGETSDDRPEFSFHYSDGTDIDLGWHHEPNPHVDAWGHYQERIDSTADYAYEPYAFSTHIPARVVWEVFSLLSDTLSAVDR